MINTLNNLTLKKDIDGEYYELVIQTKVIKISLNQLPIILGKTSYYELDIPPQWYFKNHICGFDNRGIFIELFYFILENRYKDYKNFTFINKNEYSTDFRWNKICMEVKYNLQKRLDIDIKLPKYIYYKKYFRNNSKIEWFKVEKKGEFSYNTSRSNKLTIDEKLEDAKNILLENCNKIEYDEDILPKNYYYRFKNAIRYLVFEKNDNERKVISILVDETKSIDDNINLLQLKSNRNTN